jgi:Tol biopolymer transport system component
MRRAALAFALVAMAVPAAVAPGASATRKQVPLWKIVYTRTDGRLGLWTSNQRRVFPLKGVPADPGGTGNWPAVWSPDGKYIAFSRAIGQPGIYVVRVGHGLPRRLFKTYEPAFGVSLAWSPDGRKLAFSVDCHSEIPGAACADGTVLYTIDRDGTRLRRLVIVPSKAPFVPEMSGAVWSPNGRRIAYIVTAAEGKDRPDALYTVSVAGGTPRLIAQAKRGAYHELAPPSWAPNGRWISYGDCDLPRMTSSVYCDLVVRPSSGGVARVLLTPFNGDSALGPAAWTPDSRTLLRWQGRTLFAIDFPTRRRRAVLSIDRANVIAVARDGRTFALIPDSGPPIEATLSGRIVDRGPRIPFYSGVGPTWTASLWIH